MNFRASTLTAILAVSSLSMIGCKQNKKPAPNQAKQRTKASSRPTSQPSKAKTAQKWELAKPKDAWASARAKEAKTRLQATAAGKLFWKALEAAGGLETWYKQGPIRFHFRYAPVSKKRIRDTIQTIDTWSSRGFHQFVNTPKMKFGWDGKQAWRLPKGKKQPINARFWSLTPYYFIGVPFVLADKGIVLTQRKDIKFEGKTYHQIHASFAPGTGDAPKDYYIVYIHTKTHRVGAVRYIVSYPGFFPKGGHSPEKFMSYDGTQTINGIHFPKTFRSFKWDKKRQKTIKLVTRSTFDQVSFVPQLKQSAFAPPKDAELLKGY